MNNSHINIIMKHVYKVYLACRDIGICHHNLNKQLETNIVLLFYIISMNAPFDPLIY